MYTDLYDTDKQEQMTLSIEHLQSIQKRIQFVVKNSIMNGAEADRLRMVIEELEILLQDATQIP